MKKIGLNKVKDLVTKGAFLVDIRSPVEYRDGHVSGAVNLPLRNFLNTVIGMDKARTIIIYSNTLNDVSLTQGYSYSQNLGFSNIFVATYDELRDTTNRRQTIFAGVKRPDTKSHSIRKNKVKKKGA